MASLLADRRLEIERQTLQTRPAGLQHPEDSETVGTRVVDAHAAADMPFQEFAQSQSARLASPWDCVYT
jgi:hypothetical protein